MDELRNGDGAGVACGGVGGRGGVGPVQPAHRHGGITLDAGRHPRRLGHRSRRGRPHPWLAPVGLLPA